MTPSDFADPGRIEVQTPRAGEPNHPPVMISRVLVFTDRTQVPPGRTLVQQVSACIDGGATTVVLREKDLPRADRHRFGAPIKDVLQQVGGQLIIAGDEYLAADLDAAGVHHGQYDLFASSGRGPGDVVRAGHQERRRLKRALTAVDRRGYLWGESFHAEDQMFDAVDHGCGYVTLSPVFATASKPGYGPALCLNGLGRKAAELDGWAAWNGRTVPVRLYALGGIDTAAHVRDCRQAGADGVAVMGALMRANDPAALTADLLRAATADPLAPRGPTAERNGDAQHDNAHLSDTGSPRSIRTTRRNRAAR